MIQNTGASPAVSIMIPTYNQAHFLAEAVESALAQRYPSLEVVVADDCSTDSTSQLVERWIGDPRFRYVRHQKNRGRVGNYRYTLYNLVRGRWVLNLDGDDYLCDPEYVSSAVALLEQHPDMALVFANTDDLVRGARVSSIVQRHEPILDGTEVTLGYSSIYTRRRTVVYISHATALYDAELARSLDFYRADILSSDLESLLRLIVGKKIGFIERSVACWRHHGGGATARPSPAQLFENFELVDGVYRHLCQSEIRPPRRLRQWRSQMARAKFVNDAKELIVSGQGGALPGFIGKVWQRYPEAAPSILSPAIARAVAATLAKRVLKWGS